MVSTVKEREKKREEREGERMEIKQMGRDCVVE